MEYSYYGILRSNRRHDWEKQVFKRKIVVVLGPENTCPKILCHLDRDLQKAGFLIKIRLLSYMSKKSMGPGISFHILKKLNLYH